MITLTLDTSCINAKGKNQELNQLEILQDKGLILLVRTTSVEEELLQPDDELYRSQRIEKFNKYDEVDIGIWVLGFSRLGISTKLGSESSQEEMNQMAAILFPTRTWSSLTTNQLRDIMILHTHWINKRDIFVTLNSHDFIGRRGTRKKRLGQLFNISVMTPIEALEYIKSRLNLNP